MVLGFRKHILVVEDEIGLAEGVQARLNVEGYKTTIAYDGRAGMEAAKKIRPDLILMDILMPHINGWDLCRIVKTNPKTKDIPVIMCTALGQIGDSEKAFQAGANDYITKPYDMRRLVEKVKRFLESKY
ncbi:MAG: hypothetical protein A2901_09200 [Elusimicrobia bacterium RIFCSPLOWO2_01_FULL_54_10]|nr:MAG: hypothetical protein A2901_09200 [Elusimicrobia bacterium RIFCSPLOWO2_01_FULL_54_10]